MDLYKKSALELSDLLTNKECSVKEISESLLQHSKEIEPNINAFITLDGKKISEQVTDTVAENSPLQGIPVAIEDTINVIGYPTTCASKMMKNFVSPYDATIITQLKNNGMITFGKTNLDEFAIGATGETSYFGSTKNPWNTEYVSGGSASGSAAAVGAGLVPLALGVDSGGDIRVASSFCGVVGFKPTYGTVSRYGVVPLTSSLEQAGPIARTVKDVALLFDVINGNDDKDATSVLDNSLNTSKQLDNSIAGLKIGIIKEYMDNSYNDPQVIDAVNEAVKKLEKLGAIIVEVSLPSASQVLPTHTIIAGAEASSNLGRYDGVGYGYRAENYTDWNDMFIRTRSEGFGAGVQKYIMAGTYTLTEDYYENYYRCAKSWQLRMSDEINHLFDMCDILLTPTTPTTAFPIGNSENTELVHNTKYATVLANLVGIPAISIPCGLSQDNLPIGLQLMGKPLSDAVVLNVAYQYEQSVGVFPSSTIMRGDK